MKTLTKRFALPVAIFAGSMLAACGTTISSSNITQDEFKNKFEKDYGKTKNYNLISEAIGLNPDLWAEYNEKELEIMLGAKGLHTLKPERLNSSLNQNCFLQGNTTKLKGRLGYILGECYLNKEWLLERQEAGKSMLNSGGINTAFLAEICSVSEEDFIGRNTIEDPGATIEIIEKQNKDWWALADKQRNVMMNKVHDRKNKEEKPEDSKSQPEGVESCPSEVKMEEMPRGENLKQEGGRSFFGCGICKNEISFPSHEDLVVSPCCFRVYHKGGACAQPNAKCSICRTSGRETVAIKSVCEQHSSCMNFLMEAFNKNLPLEHCAELSPDTLVEVLRAKISEDRLIDTLGCIAKKRDPNDLLDVKLFLGIINACNDDNFQKLVNGGVELAKERVTMLNKLITPETLKTLLNQVDIEYLNSLSEGDFEITAQRIDPKLFKFLGHGKLSPAELLGLSTNTHVVKKLALLNNVDILRVVLKAYSEKLSFVQTLNNDFLMEIYRFSLEKLEYCIEQVGEKFWSLDRGVLRELRYFDLEKLKFCIEKVGEDFWSLDWGVLRNLSRFSLENLKFCIEKVEKKFWELDWRVLIELRNFDLERLKLCSEKAEKKFWELDWRVLEQFRQFDLEKLKFCIEKAGEEFWSLDRGVLRELSNFDLDRLELCIKKGGEKFWKLDREVLEQLSNFDLENLKLCSEEGKEKFWELDREVLEQLSNFDLERLELCSKEGGEKFWKLDCRVLRELSEFDLEKLKLCSEEGKEMFWNLDWEGLYQLRICPLEKLKNPVVKK